MKKSLVFLGVALLIGASGPLFASGTVWSEVIDNVAFVHHDDAFWNCCPDTVFEIKPHPDTFNIIDIYERDLGTHPCDCMCYFDFSHTLEGLASGTYLARVWECYGETDEYNTLAGTTFFTILAQVGNITTVTAMSDCHDEPGVEESNEGEIGIESLSPVATTAEIHYTFTGPAEVSVEIYNVLGVRVRTIELGYLEAGEHTVLWDTRDDNGQQISRGTYFIRLVAGEEGRSLPVVILR